MPIQIDLLFLIKGDRAVAQKAVRFVDACKKLRKRRFLEFEGCRVSNRSGKDWTGTTCRKPFNMSLCWLVGGQSRCSGQKGLEIARMDLEGFSSVSSLVNADGSCYCLMS